MTQPLTDADFEAKVLQAPRPVLVHFGAPWCVPCHTQAPRIADIAQELAGRLDVYDLDVDANPEFAAQSDVRGLPAILVFKGGKVVERLIGLKPKKTILEAALKHV